jgi:hypothetical protein
VIDKTAGDAAVLGVVGFEPDEPEHFEVELDAWPVLMVFLDCQTQWRAGPNGLIGLDYGAVAWILRLRSVADEAAMLSDLQIIEAEIIQALGEQQK